MLKNTCEIIRACNQILLQVKEKSKEEANPLLIRIQYPIHQFQIHFHEVSVNQSSDKYDWSVLYRAADIVDEMATLLRNTTPVFIQTEVDFIKQCMVFFTDEVVQIFGRREALYIITPKFQQLAKLW